MAVDPETKTFHLSDLAKEIGQARAGQSNVLSCLQWAFERYGRVEPPAAGYCPYDDPDGATVDALLSIGRVVADFFGYDLRKE